MLGLDPVTEGAKLRLHTGVLTETPALDERLTARYNLHYYADLCNVPRPEVASRIETVLKTADIVEHAEQKVGTYSKGMKQRLALAWALLHEPEVLFLDEPTNGLDPIAAHHVHRLITHLSKEEGRTVFLCTHNLVEAQQLCDRVAVLEHGRLIALGTPGELICQLEQGLRLHVEIEVSIAADSIAGEKERKTLEGLLYTPTTDLEVFTAKVLSAWVLGMVVALGGFVIYSIVTNLVAWPVMGRVFFPNATRVALILWVVPAMSALGVSVMVRVSVRAKGVQEANQVGGVMVLPIMLLVIGQATGLVLFNIWLAVLLGLLTWGVDVLLLWIGGRVFQRGEIITRL